MAPKTPRSESSSSTPHFKSGTLVEISSDDPGFRGSWYTGKVLRRISSQTPSKFSVAYTHIFADEAGIKPLSEVFDSTYQLRPPPPPSSERERAAFKFGDEVDAYYNDGWWEGTITKEIGSDRFKVFFRGTREQLVFSREQLRVHREWIDGVWNPPIDGEQQQQYQNPPDPNPTGVNAEEKLGNEVPVETVPNTSEKKDEKTAETEQVSGQGADVEVRNDDDGETKVEEIFKPGTLVEVSSDEEGFIGAWFTATTVKAAGNDKFLVEYQNLRTEDDTENLTEEIDTQHIRPHPPEKIMVDSYTLYDEVDAWYNEAWWVGVVTKVRSNSKYTVYFKDTKENLEFEHSNLRVHQEWIDGKWYTSSKPVKK